MIRQHHVFHLLSDYIDGCLPAAATRRVEAHLASCPTCAGELEQWRAVLQLVSRHAAVPCPIDCAEVVVQRLNEGSGRWEGGTGARHRYWAPYSFIWVSVATALMMLLGSWTWLQSSKNHLGSTRSVQVTRPAALLPVAPAVHVDAPDRLEGAFGHSDSLILASDFADNDR
jgi:anti-sigma factor RsiW